ncbi:bifunctional diaminohydroxyphosphoribosylaminopyrimidine deaminase/5-amino-6-(5-phosphoribosylamino)uracil reductase RibD [Adhaeribacter sp. BT258]|uniref:Riboflavin biosynthesis protein RibD n=1 Tax=Adhaeribacter terrigena TaxID=2793070 RepID=A0ABS1C459_9BACT|nr:bifunctional diaminohydroxyphosphoribosylaminopyrimidine deaminase/5-amino-6-(5-phosphoribosylamino)uracil reductase RibD [Adhaeribacter terrigena]MBK0404176.1 bifunctional diaminohydroxyphosphoribosylaminopyrimidine deaminase/5-amino-6-(5-phosphoribosylamino)uracil reductase RibD [Adhaeribacter terrigena]
MTSADELFMQRALELAENGAGFVRPNPMVGCVIVHNNQIIGEGWHQKFGGPHAEVNAIISVKDKNLLKESTVYVTLEPCSHFGKTPPCADLLIKYGVQKVIICNEDPNPLVAGRGIIKLREAGIVVQSGFLAEKGSVLNRRFFCFHQKQRPYIVLKWAETADGFIAKENYEPVAISGSLAKNLVHKWRTEEAAIFVGSNTAKFDNPKLSIREWFGPPPVRLVIDKNLSLSPHLHLFDKSQPTIVLNFQRDEVLHENLELVRLELEANFLSQMLYHLHQKQIQSVLVEGGTFLLKAFLQAGTWDEARVFRSSERLGSGIPAPELSLHKLAETTSIGENQLFLHRNV